MKNWTEDDSDAPLAQTLRVVEVIDCIAANAPDKNGRPVTMVTLAYLGELEQPLCLSFDDTKLLVTTTDHHQRIAALRVRAARHPWTNQRG